MTSLRDAVHHVLPEIRDIFIEFQPRLRLMVNYQGQNIPFLQLSQTYKTWTALVGDLVRRLCILNPNSLYPCLEGTGIVLIDEVDLQLDQSHRQSILLRLQRAFPNLQFIVSGTSPDLLDQCPHIECYQLQQQQVLKLDLLTHQQNLLKIYQPIEMDQMNEQLPSEQTGSDIPFSELDLNEVVRWAKGLSTEQRTQLFQELLELPQQDDQL